MSLLLILWLGSLLAMGAILGYAHAKGTVDTLAPTNFGEFFRRESQQVAGSFRQLIARLRPHAKHAVISGIVVLRRSQDRFIERVFGHIEVEKGKTASFFLKHIAEHKETTKNDIDRRVA